MSIECINGACPRWNPCADECKERAKSAPAVAPMEPLPEGLTDEAIQPSFEVLYADRHGYKPAKQFGDYTSEQARISFYWFKHGAALSASAPPQPVQAPVGGGWLPIETAPFDYDPGPDVHWLSECLLLVKGVTVQGMLSGDQWLRRDDQSAPDRSWDDLNEKPTHWMPRPAAPGAAEQPAPQAPEVGVEPHGFLYDWTHSSATGRPDEEFTGFTKTLADAKRHTSNRNIRPVYTAEQLSSLRESHEMLEWLALGKSYEVNVPMPNGRTVRYIVAPRPEPSYAEAFRAAIRSAMAASPQGGDMGGGDGQHG
jgi:hypothetical protein